MVFSSPAVLAQTDDLSDIRDELTLLREQVRLLEQRLEDADKEPESSTQESIAAPQESLTFIPDSIVHLAGYGAANFVDTQDGESGFGGVLFAPIFHYQYKDLLLFEGELEVEIDDSGETEVTLEYLTLDLFLNDNAALVAGKFLSPVGQFVQNLHPSWVNKMPSAPLGFAHDEAAPLSDVGLQIRGGFNASESKVNYAVFVGNGPRMEVEVEEHDDDDGDDDDHGLGWISSKDGDDDHGDGGSAIDGELSVHGIESEGFVSNADGEYVFGGRVGFLPWPALEIGLSAATGEIGMYVGSDYVAIEPNRDYDVLGADFVWSFSELQVRGEYLRQEVGNNALSSIPEGFELSAWYLQGSFRLPKTKWEGVLRYSEFDGIESHADREQFAVGLNYLFANNVIGKIAYELNDGEAGSPADSNRFLLQIAYGF